MVGCGGTGAASPPAPSAGGVQTEVALGQEFALRVGQTVALGDGTGLRLTFNAVREDSRCPVGVTCVWAGDAVVAIIIDDGSSGADTVELHTNADFDTEAPLDGHTVRLVELTPIPREGSTIEIDQYQATLVVSRRELMAAFAASGNNVLFVENTGVRSPTSRDLPRLYQRIRNWQRGAGGLREERKTLCVHAPLISTVPVFETGTAS